MCKRTSAEGFKADGYVHQQYQSKYEDAIRPIYKGKGNLEGEPRFLKTSFSYCTGEAGVATASLAEGATP